MNRIILLLTFLLLSVSVMAEPPTDPPADSACTVNTDCTGGQECDSSSGECYTPVVQAEGETCSSGQVWNRRSGQCINETVSPVESGCPTQVDTVISTDPNSEGEAPQDRDSGSSSATR
jgi:hypothetical protein